MNIDLPRAFALCARHTMLPPNSSVLCAVSGGADSVCLLHWLSRLREHIPFTLTAAHYNHHLRGPQSDADEAFVRKFVCTLPNVQLICGSGDVAGQSQRDKTGIEQTARAMRYDFLAQTAQQIGAQIICTAHNADDNAETLLMNLMRGCGLNGLCGIPPVRGNIVRPLLTTPRSEILEYLCRHGLDHVEDSSNCDTRYTRNRLRHTVMPALRQMDPEFVSHVARTAQLLRADEGLLQQQASRALIAVAPVCGGCRTDAASIAALPDPLAARAVQQLWGHLDGCDGTCTAAHLEAVIALCRGTDPSARICLPDGVTARRVYDKLELIRETAPPAFDPVPLPLPGQVTLPWGTVTAACCQYTGQRQTGTCFYLSRDAVYCGITLRPRHTGDVLTAANGHTRTIKKLLIDKKIPRHTREQLPVLDCAGRCVGAALLGPDSGFLPRKGEDCWQIRFSRQEKGNDPS